jgi:hypothetical protein
MNRHGRRQAGLQPAHQWSGDAVGGLSEIKNRQRVIFRVAVVGKDVAGGDAKLLEGGFPFSPLLSVALARIDTFVAGTAGAGMGRT